MQEFATNQDAAYFVDPPYTAVGKKAGQRLYKHYNLDHELLFTICESLKGDFLITYDNAEEVKRMARNHSFQMRIIPMTNTHHATMDELVIGNDLTWMDRCPMVHEPESGYLVRKTRRKRSNTFRRKRRSGAVDGHR
jgi:DNA adenine methylase